MSPSDRKRVRINSVICLLLWVAGVTLMLAGAPFFSFFLVGLAGAYFALRDWDIVRKAAKESLGPPHADPDVQAVIDQRIDIPEYRRRQEGGDVSNPSSQRTVSDGR